MKTIQTLFFAAILFFCSQNLNAQSVFGASLVGGANIVQMLGDEDGGYNRIALHAGIKSSIRLSYRMEMGIGIQYDQRGSSNRVDLNNVEPFKIKIDYITVPVTYSFKDMYDEEDGYYHIHFTTGLVYGRLFQSSQEGGRILNECLEDFRENDISWMLGASYFWTEHWGASVYHIRSVIDANKTLDHCARDLRPFQWTFRVEYKF